MRKSIRLTIVGVLAFVFLLLCYVLFFHNAIILGTIFQNKSQLTNFYNKSFEKISEYSGGSHFYLTISDDDEIIFTSDIYVREVTLDAYAMKFYITQNDEVTEYYYQDGNLYDKTNKTVVKSTFADAGNIATNNQFELSGISYMILGFNYTEDQYKSDEVTAIGKLNFSPFYLGVKYMKETKTSQTTIYIQGSKKIDRYIYNDLTNGIVYHTTVKDPLKPVDITRKTEAELANWEF